MFVEATYEYNYLFKLREMSSTTLVFHFPCPERSHNIKLPGGKTQNLNVHGLNVQSIEMYCKLFCILYTFLSIAYII